MHVLESGVMFMCWAGYRQEYNRSLCKDGWGNRGFMTALLGPEGRHDKRLVGWPDLWDRGMAFHSDFSLSASRFRIDRT